MKTIKQFKTSRILNIIGYSLWCIFISSILVIIWTVSSDQMDVKIFLSCVIGWLLIISTTGIIMTIRETYGSYLNKLKNWNDKEIEKDSKDIERLKKENEKIIEILKK